MRAYSHIVAAWQGESAQTATVEAYNALPPYGATKRPTDQPFLNITRLSVLLTASNSYPFDSNASSPSGESI